MDAKREEPRDERLNALLQQWNGVEPRASFEAAVWRRIRIAAEPESQPIPTLSLWREWLFPGTVRVSAMAAALGILVGIWAGYSAPARDGHKAAEPLLHPQTLAGLQDLTRLTRSLDLSEVQAREIKAIHASLGAKLSDCCVRHCAARARLGQALAAETNGAGRAEAVLAEMCRAHEQSERATLDHIRQVRAVLTVEQRQRFDEMIADCMCRTCNMHGGAACPPAR
jgi:Spy/CpxP family protein refolding chaperone